MKEEKRSVEFEHFNNYKVTHHIGSDIIEIEKMELETPFLRNNKWVWNRVYMGPVGVIEKVLKFYKKSKKENNTINLINKKKKITK